MRNRTSWRRDENRSAQEGKAKKRKKMSKGVVSVGPITVSIGLLRVRQGLLTIWLTLHEQQKWCEGEDLFL